MENSVYLHLRLIQRRKWKVQSIEKEYLPELDHPLLPERGMMAVPWQIQADSVYFSWKKNIQDYSTSKTVSLEPAKCDDVL